MAWRGECRETLGRQDLTSGQRTRTWQASIGDHPPSVQYEDVQESGLGQLLKNIVRMRRQTTSLMLIMCSESWDFVSSKTRRPPRRLLRLFSKPSVPSGTPITVISTSNVERSSSCLFLAGGFYDFTADLSSKDTAYTSEHLEPHNDNTYFTEAAGLQALHLLSHTEGSGGESSLVDGFEAARQLFQLDRDAYGMLGKVGVYGHASGNEGISIQPAEAAPVLNHHQKLGSLMQVRWNNADRAGLDCSVRDFDAWYDAAE